MSNDLDDNCDIDIDIVGDYHCISITNSRGEQELTSNGLISVDYTVNPLWLSENSLEWNNREQPELSLENCDEINDNQNLIYENDIPAYGEEVVAYGDEDSYEISQDDSIDSFSENLDSNTNSNVSSTNSRSLLKINQIPCKFKQTLLVNRSLLKSNQRQLQATSELLANSPHLERCVSDISISSHSSITSTLSPSILVSSSPSPERIEYPQELPEQKTKFRQTVKFHGENLVCHKQTIKMIKNKIKAMNNKVKPEKEKEKKRKRKKHKKYQRKSSNSSNSLEQLNVNLLEPKSHTNLVNLGEIVKVAKDEDVDSDVVIDVDSDSNDPLVVDTPMMDEGPPKNEMVVDGEDQRLLELKITNPTLCDFLESCEIPQEEVKMEASEISDLEKFMCFEFFSGKTTKTPDRYLRIRNHILGIWYNMKPTYLSKTQARQGLKNCGDVNCISRIHSLLEQVGAINFGCHDNFQYVRPLKVVFYQLQIPPKPRISSSVVQPSNISNFITEKRQRIRNYNNSYNSFSSEDVLLNDANYTIQHMENTPRPAYTPPPTTQNDKDTMINRIKSRTKHRKDFELVKCQRFSRENIAPFKVSISLSTLLCLYFHALSSKLEIMGFLGGHVDKSVNKLSLTRYKPCRTSMQSGINCEMCPISQVEQSSILTNLGYELLGWFHSHPLFPPNPSRTDLKTQTEMQMQFASNNPFIGFILSCVDLEFKCIYMCADSPFELDVEIVKDYVDFNTEIKDIFNIVDKYDSNYQETMERFTNSGNALFKQLSVNECIENLIKDFI